MNQDESHNIPGKTKNFLRKQKVSHRTYSIRCRHHIVFVSQYRQYTRQYIGHSVEKVSPHLQIVQRIFLTPDFAMLNQLAFQNFPSLKRTTGPEGYGEKKKLPEELFISPFLYTGCGGTLPPFPAPCHKPKIPLLC